MLEKAKRKGEKDKGGGEQKIVSKSIKIPTQANYSPLVPRESAQMMRNFFKPTTSNEQDDLEPDGSEREDLDMSSQNDLDGMREANRAMEYDSDTSNDEPMDCEGDGDERWGDEQPEEGELSSVEGAGGSSEPEDQPRRKRQKLNVPTLTARRTAREN